ncbi:MAG: biotin--[acetyl-CoA-carboxylase] ligase [Armatimonadetes bacterium]|nr:biotin--[acetyl-CoA-carboxylase] ligase [Armatimonadota bacterium]
MKAPSGPFLTYNELGSTQDEAKKLIASSAEVGVVFARHQSQGRGRFDRIWVSQEGESLTFSLALHDYANHPKPYLVGMAISLGVCLCLDARIQWPNDVTVGGRKLGGILTELVTDPNGNQIPVVGAGINLNQTSFPDEIAHRATSLYIECGLASDALTVAEGILSALANVPEPTNWEAIAPLWHQLDDTPGKQFRLPTGEEATALGVGPGGELRCLVGEEERLVYAAEALNLHA